MCRPWSDTCTGQPVGMLLAFYPLFSQFSYAFSSLIHLNLSLFPALVLSLNSLYVLYDDKMLFQASHKEPHTPAGSNPSNLQGGPGAPVDPPGGWHSWATGQTACYASLGRRRVRGPLALVGLPGSLPRSLFSPPLH